MCFYLRDCFARALLRKTHLRSGTEVSLYYTVSQSVLPLKFSSPVFSNIECLKWLLILNHLKSQAEQLKRFIWRSSRSDLRYGHENRKKKIKKKIKTWKHPKLIKCFSCATRRRNSKTQQLTVIWVGQENRMIIVMLPLSKSSVVKILEQNKIFKKF